MRIAFVDSTTGRSLSVVGWPVVPRKGEIIDFDGSDEDSVNGRWVVAELLYRVVPESDGDPLVFAHLTRR